MSDMFTWDEAFKTQPDDEGARLSGYKVHATDGDIGKVDDLVDVPGESYLVVSTGGTIFSKQVVLPAGIVERVDDDGKAIYVNRSQDDIKAAPEFDEEIFRDAAYRDRLAAHYRR